MSNSSLVSYINLSPNYSEGRNHIIDRITPHYCGGDCSVEGLGEIFAPTSRRASSNYGIGSDGRVGMYVEEHNRAWTSGSSYNDNRAVTIECANLADGSLTDECWNGLVDLCVDICQRNGIEKLVYTGDDSGNLTMHKWYDDTDCPGPWLSYKFDDLANEVNDVLQGGKHSSQTEDEMLCIIRANEGNTMYYVDGANVHPLAHPDEMKAIQEVYKITHNGNEIPCFDYGTPEAPWATRLFDALNRKM